MRAGTAAGIPDQGSTAMYGSTVTGPVHIAPWGTSITTPEPDRRRQPLQIWSLMRSVNQVEKAENLTVVTMRH